MPYSNQTLNLAQVDSTFNEKIGITGYFTKDLDIGEYTFAPFIDYTASKDVQIPSEFKSIRVIIIGGGGGGGASGTDYFEGTLGPRFNYGGGGGGGGCGQINSTVIDNVDNVGGTKMIYYRITIGQGGQGGPSYTFYNSSFGQGSNGSTTVFSLLPDGADNYIVKLNALGGIGGGAGSSGGSGGSGGLEGTSYGWVNNVNYYRHQGTRGTTSGQNSTNISPGGKGGYLSGWSNNILYDKYGRGGDGATTLTHYKNSDYNTINNFDNSASINGNAGNPGFARVYFFNFKKFSHS